MNCFKCGYTLFKSKIINCYQYNYSLYGKSTFFKKNQYLIKIDKDSVVITCETRFYRQINNANTVYKFGIECYYCGAVYLTQPSFLTNKRSDIPKIVTKARNEIKQSNNHRRR